MTQRFALRTLLWVAMTACGGRTGIEVPLPPDTDAAVPPEPIETRPPGCGPSTCAGCCDESGTCQPGNTEAACGEMGRACVVCNPRFDVCSPDPQNPDGQVCFSPCDFKACNYHCCLRTHECVSGESDDACGSTGQLCVDCASTGQRCDTASWPHHCVAP